MERLSLTNHAQIRLQQRCVPTLIVDWLLDYGALVYDGHGAQIRFFDKKSLKALAQSAGQGIVKQLSKYMKAYIVTDEDTVITVGYLYKRVYR